MEAKNFKLRFGLEDVTDPDNKIDVVELSQFLFSVPLDWADVPGEVGEKLDAQTHCAGIIVSKFIKQAIAAHMGKPMSEVFAALQAAIADGSVFNKAAH